MAMVVDKSKCCACESCVGICPVGAISIVDGKAQVDSETCISCGACVGECPCEAIAPEGATAQAEAPKAAAADKDIWVICEPEGGQINATTFEMLAVAQDLAQKAKYACCAVYIGPKGRVNTADLIAGGADKVYVIEDDKYETYNTELYTDGICQLIKAYNPSAVMMGATCDGRDLAPRIAARMKTGLCADCTEVDITEDGLVAWTRPALGGNIYATIVCDEMRPQMGTVRPKVFKALEKDASRTGEVINFVPAPGCVSRIEVVEVAPLVADNAIKIEEADVICAGGRGFGEEENFKVLEQLAALFENSAIAGSRAAVDEGWISHGQQVGQSGKTVTPKLYFACGISGAIQHISGMKDADCIVAINRDSHAPIFTVAHYGIVGDVKVILPKLIEKIKAYKEQ